MATGRNQKAEHLEVSSESRTQSADAGPRPKRGNKRLGKGLSALLGEYLPEESTEAHGGYQEVPVDRIGPNPEQPRTTFDDEELTELENSIRANGLLQPLVVRPAAAGTPADIDWELIAGERRWRAIRRLGWTEVPVVVRDIDDETMVVLAIVENVQRKNLTPFEEAAGYQRLVDLGFTQEEIAKEMGTQRSTIANSLRLLKLPRSIQRLVNPDQLTIGHAKALLGLSDERKMSMLARRAVQDGLTVRAVEEQVRRLKESNRDRSERAELPPPAPDPHLRRLETELQRALGTAARIKVGRGKQEGKIEIPFYDADDFDRVVELLLGPDADI